MYKIKIKFIGLGYGDVNQSYVKLYDENNNLIKEGLTYDNTITFLLEKGSYKVIASNYNQTITAGIYVYNDYSYTLVFNNAIFINKRRVITFILRDYYYNLKIEKGIMRL